MSIQYATRPDALSKDVIVRIAGSEIVRDDGDVVAHYLFIDVNTMRLAFDPSRAETGRYRCDLELVTGNAISFTNLSWRGIADFEDRSNDYAAFVQRLARTLADANPACRFLAGKPPWSYWLQIVFVGAALMALATVLASFGVAYIGATAWAKLALAAILTPVLVRWIRRNRERRFDPRAIPEAILPPVTSGSP